MRVRPGTWILAAAAMLALGGCGDDDRADPPSTVTTQATDAVAGGTAEITAGDSTFSFSLTDCYASPDDGLRFRGETDEGTQITVDYSVDAPDDTTLQVTDGDGTVILDGSAIEGVESPAVQLAEDGFQATATLRQQDGTTIDGQLSGAC